MDELEILLVEDNPADAELTLRALKKNNIANNITVVGDGEAALNLIFAKGEYENRVNENFPKLILLDLKLPKISGLEVLAALKGNPKTRVIPIVVLTSSKEEKDIIESYKLGVNSYIVKPVDFDKFFESVKELGMFWLVMNQPPIHKH
jgi:two-component system, response regulator